VSEAAHAELVELLRRGKTGKVALDDERPVMRGRRQGGVGLGVDRPRFPPGPVGDPHLAAIEARSDRRACRRGCASTPTSEPEPTSDIASAPTCFAGDELGEIAPSLAISALRRIWFTHRFEWAPYESPTEPEARDTSSMADAMGEVSEPGPSQFLLHGNASSPRLPISGHKSRGKVLSRSIASARGAIRSWAKLCNAIRAMHRRRRRARNQSHPRALGIIVFLSVRSIRFYRPDQRMSAARRELARTAGRAPGPRPRNKFYQALQCLRQGG